MALPPSPLTRGGVGSRRAFLGATAAVAAGCGDGRRRRPGAEGQVQRRRVARNVTLPRPARPLPPVPAGSRPASTASPLRHPQPRLLPHRHGADRPPGAGRGLDAGGHRHGRPALRAHLRRALRARHRRGRHHHDVRVNPVGGDLVGHARWLGMSTRDLLDWAGVRRGADQVVGQLGRRLHVRLPLSAVYDRPALVAIGMNGEPLPLRHGFPARLVTPGSTATWALPVADRDRGHHLRRLRPVLGACEATPTGHHQDDDPDRHAPQLRDRSRGPGGRGRGWPGRRPGHRSRRDQHRRRRVRAGPARRTS